MQYRLRTLLIFVVAIAIGVCVGALITGAISRAPNPKSPIFLVVLLSLSMIAGGASCWIFTAMHKWAKASKQTSNT